MTDGLLTVSDLHVSFPTRQGVIHALNGVSFEIQPGALVGMIGETGCGKSVTSRSILRIIRAPGQVDGGSIRFKGCELLSLRESQLRAIRGAEIGFIPQDPIGALDPILSIGTQFRNVIRAHQRLSAAECHRRAARALANAGIAEPDRILRGYAHQLSGGMAQRVVIALATILDPAVVIADEPTTGLDVTIQRQILDLIATRFRAESRTLLLVTHDLGVVAEYCDEVLVMYAGKVVEQGSVGTVFKSPRHPYTRLLIDSVELRQLDAVDERLPLPLDLVNYPQGCPFAHRCPLVFERCRVEAPAPQPVPGGGSASCFLANQVPEHAAARG